MNLCVRCLSSEPEYSDIGLCHSCGMRAARRYQDIIIREYLKHAEESRAKRNQQIAEKRWEKSVQALLHQGFTQPPGTSYVYYVQIGQHIKIGHSSNVVGRLQTLRVDRSALLALEPGGYAEEQERHEQFANLRVSKRWENFHPGPELLAHIDRLTASHGIPPWVHAPRRHGKNGPVTVRQVK